MISLVVPFGECGRTLKSPESFFLSDCVRHPSSLRSPPKMFAKCKIPVPSVRVAHRGFRTSTVTRTKAAASFNKQLQNTIKEIQEAGTYKKERVILSPQSSEIEVVNPSTGKKVKVLNFWYVLIVITTLLCV